MLVRMKTIALACIVGLLLTACAPPDVFARTIPVQGESRIEIEEIKAEIQALQNKKVRILLTTTDLVEGTLVGVGDSTFWLGSGQLSSEIAFSDVEAIKKLEGGLSKLAKGLLITGIVLVSLFLVGVAGG